MERILLVEPNYKNKYPPIGLMKISTYYKNKGDYVQFHKGLLSVAEVKTYDRVFITTLFTFDFDICVEAIRYYHAVIGCDNVFVGGIAATIMPERFETAIPGVRLLTGQLVSSDVLGYGDNINIDILDLDYDILWDIPYTYPAADSYFIYTSRGCPRKCPFCAVKSLEPVFYECENVREQIQRVDAQFGIKRNLLIMDNNALFAPHLPETIRTIENLGFGANNNTAKKCNQFPFMLRSLSRRRQIGKTYTHLLQRIKQLFRDIKLSRISNVDIAMLQPIIQTVQDDRDSAFLEYLSEHQAYLENFFERYHYHTIKRYVDFNQGLDARLFTPEKAQLLAQIALKPCRIAFDDIRTKDEYFRAVDLASKSGILHFSNYLLYNYRDDPRDLWQRLFLNVNYCEKHPEIKTLFSFPMKYAAIDHTDRSYVGQLWNKKFLKSMNVILNVTSGVVPKEKDFFLRAFGCNPAEFLAILAMPDDYIRYRDYFDSQGLISAWQRAYVQLDDGQRTELVNLLSEAEVEVQVMDQRHDQALDSILLFYTVRKRKFEQNPSYYHRLFDTVNVQK